MVAESPRQQLLSSDRLQRYYKLMDIQQSTRAYELWLSKELPILPADLRLKHQRMKQSAFAFLRATFYRWAQLWPEVCSELASAPKVLGVGDLHLENFGTWRDSEGRLAWGVNDFDEACQLPYPADLVRLAASAQLGAQENHLVCDWTAVCEAILAGYREALMQGGKPFVLAEHHRWLRDLAFSNLRDPVTFWDNLQQWPRVDKTVPAQVQKILKRALPGPVSEVRVVHRKAGLGSLGRRRFTLLAQWSGGLIAREAKELASSAWSYGEKNRSGRELFYFQAVARAVRVPDPFLHLDGQWVVRRLAPDCSRIALSAMPKQKDPIKLGHAMGWETANIHLGTSQSAGTLLKDLKNRPGDWLRKSSAAMTKATLADWEKWRSK
jgi:hypothetical protein